MRKVYHLLPLLLSLAVASPVVAQKFKEPFLKDEWVQDYAPFRIAGNLYYVGSNDLGCYLITTPQGHILINTGVASSADMLQKHMAQLGFNLKDVRILLTTQVHYDHVGAFAELKRRTHAQIMVQEADAAVLADGGKSDYYFHDMAPVFEPVKPDRILHDGDVVELGGARLQLLHHPGHTKGSCSFVLDVADGRHTYRVLIANMPSVIVEENVDEVVSYPGMAADYDYTFASLKKQHFDLWVASHASQFNMHQKHKPGDKYNPEAFRDDAGFRQSVAELEKAYFKKR